MRKWNNKQVDVTAISEIDCARLAAFIDSEGCFRIQPTGGPRRNRYHNLRIIVCQADVRLMEWLFETFGGRYEKGHGGTNRPMYYWFLDGAYMTSVLGRLMPYFLLKGDQAQIFLEYRKTLTKGRTPLTDEVIKQREALKNRLHVMKHPEKQPA